jgi:hypothetical protein
MFNALKYTQELEQAGFTREEAEVSVRILIEVMNDNFATKSDMQAGFAAIRADMRELEYKHTIKLGTMMATMLTLAIAVTTAIVKLT